MNGDNKRKKLFRYFKSSDFDFICLQETHSQLQTAKRWKNEWGENLNFKSHWNSGTNMSCGVAILLKNATSYKLIDTREDDEGRMLLLTLKIDNIAVQLASIYAPNRPHLRTTYHPSFSL